MSEAGIWIVEDDRSVRFVLAEALREAGYRVREFESAGEALQALDSTRPELVFTDVRMPGVGGLEFLDTLKQRAPELPVVVMSAYTDLASTTGAFRGGAHEFLSKPFDLDAAVALAARVLERDPAAGVATVADDAAELVGDSAQMRALFRAIGRLSQAPLSVLVIGETGTGKELVARALHRHSPRAARPFVALNTAAIPAELLESELFGHEAGAFTGARERRPGRFEQAHGGTLFLDEIGDMPLPLQTRLLRVLAEGEFFRVGGRELIEVDVRVITATHQDLAALVQAGRFRADLLHRLDVVRLALPPLRERREDIGALAERFLAQAAERLGTPLRRLGRDARERLLSHAWPGNVRELENLCWRLAALAPAEVIRAADLPPGVGDGEGAAGAGAHGWEAALRAWAQARLAEDAPGTLYAHALERFEQVLLEAALAATGGHRQRAAERLGVGRNTLTRKLGSSRRRPRQR
ncbi:MAG TPA: nitrogen regulation protein NR(I) [Xanthomonadaceae bacterium]|nr:nitrogen regulation protein NR(I) [Xanthomonadaceae bacterium]